MKIARAMLAFGLAGLLLAGCSSTGDLSASTASSTPRATSTPTLTPTPTPTLEPEPIDYSIECFDAAYKGVTFRTFRDVWASPTQFTSCKPAEVRGDYQTDVQKAAFAASGYTDPESIGFLFSICASLAFGYQSTATNFSPGQVAEITGALTLCPDHPVAAAIAARTAAGQAEQTERDAGTRFGSGIRQVGVDVQPGVYASEGQISGCYWERLDAAGNIIDNNFLSSALRVEVTIEAGDFSFSSSDCGEWVKIG